MENLSTINKGLTIDSTEIAGMIEKDHDKLLRDIRNYILQMNKFNEELEKEDSPNLVTPINPNDYFIESTYTNSQNKPQPCFLLTKLGCEFVSNKMTGVKGTGFTAIYTKKFNEMENGRQSTNYIPISPIIKDELEIAELMAEHTGVNKGIAIAVALSRSENKTGESLEEYKVLLPAATHYTGYLTVKAMSTKLNISSIKINKKLEGLGLQYKESYTRKSTKTGKDKTESQWRITDKGKEHGEEFPYSNHGHSGYQIKWNESVIELLGGETDAI